MGEPLLVAFTTCASAAALPLNIQAVEKLGVPKSISSFTIPLGNTINMDGAAIYLGVAAIFISEVFGIPLDFNQQLTIILMAILASIGSVGVPGAALIVMTMVFTAVGLPMEGSPWWLVLTGSWIWPGHHEYLGNAVGAIVVFSQKESWWRRRLQFRHKPGVLYDKAGWASLIL